MYDLLIATFSRFIKLDDIEKVYLMTIFKEKQVQKNDFFLKEGTVCREVGFIIKGMVRYYINKDGEEKIYGFGKEGDFVCNYESFLSKQPSGKNIRHMEEGVLLTVSYDNLQLFYKNVRQGERFGRLISEHLFVEALGQITSLYTDSAEDRYHNFVQLYPDLQQRIPQYYISSYVGVKPQSLSRIRKRIAAH
ncbi:Crp/Fnr family transcriptional regulator [Niabella ginsenosidivorans]|uniref:Crp/Fnr family transcriptional regulator n=1 Tax=Niabella ginsenosidivorans TaxID=1176587 RepID=A0A1A9I7J3_9BACT|nr:Crp/Fnr family transcriptional regulator [Niabella ginsenosidivorans]ANH83647.1 Crp/Fnr family transcriptional regulator [Niabella ginsenosidivorans]